MKDIQLTNHALLDEICPDTFEEMRNNDGLGSDNMTIIIIDFLQNSGGANGKQGVKKSNSNTSNTGPSGGAKGLNGQSKQVNKK